MPNQPPPHIRQVLIEKIMRHLGAYPADTRGTEHAYPPAAADFDPRDEEILRIVPRRP